MLLFTYFCFLLLLLLCLLLPPFMSFYGVLKINVSAACPPRFLLFFFVEFCAFTVHYLSFPYPLSLSFQPHPGFHQYLWVQVPFKRNPFICCILGPFVVCMVGCVAMVPAMLELGLKLSAMQSLHHSLAPFMRQKNFARKEMETRKWIATYMITYNIFTGIFMRSGGDGEMGIWNLNGEELNFICERYATRVLTFLLV